MNNKIIIHYKLFINVLLLEGLGAHKPILSIFFIELIGNIVVLCQRH